VETRCCCRRPGVILFFFLQLIAVSVPHCLHFRYLRTTHGRSTNLCVSYPHPNIMLFFSLSWHRRRSCWNDTTVEEQSTVRSLREYYDARYILWVKIVASSEPVNVHLIKLWKVVENMSRQNRNSSYGFAIHSFAFGTVIIETFRRSISASIRRC